MKNKEHQDLPGVGCEVSACKYNTVDCRCCAEQIHVQNEAAMSKGETYCATFAPRGCCDSNDR